jgi:hypothetical protein
MVASYWLQVPSSSLLVFGEANGIAKEMIKQLRIFNENSHCRISAILASLQKFCNGRIIAEIMQFPL